MHLLIRYFRIVLTDTTRLLYRGRPRTCSCLLPARHAILLQKKNVPISYFIEIHISLRPCTQEIAWFSRQIHFPVHSRSTLQIPEVPSVFLYVRHFSIFSMAPGIVYVVSGRSMCTSWASSGADIALAWLRPAQS